MAYTGSVVGFCHLKGGKHSSAALEKTCSHLLVESKADYICSTQTSVKYSNQPGAKYSTWEPCPDGDCNDPLSQNIPVCTILFN